jgi:hypothetical protein
MKCIKKHYCQLHYAQQHQITPGMLQNEDGLIRTFIIPVRLLDKYRSEFEERASTIDSVHIYKGPIEGQITTYLEQTLKALKIHARKSNHVS